jgi:hypothetical protein
MTMSKLKPAQIVEQWILDLSAMSTPSKMLDDKRAAFSRHLF